MKKKNRINLKIKFKFVLKTKNHYKNNNKVIKKRKNLLKRNKFKMLLLNNNNNIHRSLKQKRLKQDLVDLLL